MLEKLLFGKLTIDSIPFYNPIIMAAGGMMVLVAVFVLGYLTITKKWGYLWREWITTIDHKKIGIMYILLASVMLLRGFADAGLMLSLIHI